jgi:hypothetical protein
MIFFGPLRDSTSLSLSACGEGLGDEGGGFAPFPPLNPLPASRERRSKSISRVLFTPGFSQVVENKPQRAKPFKRFPIKSALRDTWLKPGVNETEYAAIASSRFWAAPMIRT